MDLQGKRVLVTGGTGFVGSHLVERLVTEGCRVRVLGNYQSQPSVGSLAFVDPKLLDQVEITWGDVRDRDSVLAVANGVSVVFHLAALIGIPYSYVAPGSYVDTNVSGTLNVLQAVRTCGVERLVHTSTSEAYGSAQYTPIDERHPLVGQSPYAATKIGADKLVESFVRSFELSAVTIRPFNVFGPRQSDRAIIPTLIAQGLSDGDAIRMGDPAPKRDFTYVSDTVDGFVRAATCDEAIGRTINIGSGRSISMGQVADRIRELTGGGRVEIDQARIRPKGSEVSELLCDATLAGDVLGWKALVTLDEGLSRTIDFVAKAPHLYTPNQYRL